ncbi:MAG: SAM-dependent chlorinase/fluorinase [Nitrospirae bacterium]|nr:SAM-dependent chlorinase/fluorinase [Nitrospirota bacterium]
MLAAPIITLTTDFGLKDPFAGLMKGVMLGINPNAKVIDITHNIQRHNIFEASRVIAMSYKYFPTTTIHVVVVDPGVGSMRRPLLIVTEDHYFIGPDNGIFTPILEDLKSTFLKVYNVTASHYFLPIIGSTFHGRDIFAPVAAWLSKGVDSHKMGEQIDDYMTIPSPKPMHTNNNTITGEIISIDIFGNGASNIAKDDLAKLASIESKENFRVLYNNEHLHIANFYAENKNNSLAAIINSFGYIELFVFQGSASEKYNIKIGDKVIVSLA